MEIKDYKIIFTGTTGVGKTTAIETLSDVDVVGAGNKPSDRAQDKEAQTSMEMDYGVVLEREAKLHLYGAQGAENISFMGELPVEGVGLIVLIDNTRDDPMNDLQSLLNTFQDLIGQVDIAVGITRTDLIKKPTIEEYRVELKARSLNPPVFEVDTRQKNDISLLVQGLIYSIKNSG